MSGAPTKGPRGSACLWASKAAVTFDPDGIRKVKIMYAPSEFWMKESKDKTTINRFPQWEIVLGNAYLAQSQRWRTGLVWSHT